MTDDTPDRAALAKRLKPLAFGADAACNSCWCDIGPHRGCPIKAAYRALSAAPAVEQDDSVPGPLDLAYQRGVATERAHWRKATGRQHWNDAAPVPLTPSVAEAREAVLIVLQGEFPDPRDVGRVDALIAAVRAETVAEAVRAVEALPRYVLNLNLRQGTAPNMEPAAHGAWVGQTDAIAALRALGGQP